MARLFNGTNTYLSLASAPVTTVPLSVSLWFYPAATNATYDAIFIKNTGGDRYFGIYLNAAGTSAKVGAVVSNAGGEGLAESTTTFSANTWNHACGVFTSATSRAAFLNGGGKATNATNIAPTLLGNVNIGGFFVSPSVFGPMNGRLAEVGIWNVALTDDEVLSLSKGVSPYRVRPGSLIAYWPLYGNGSPEPNYSRNSTDLSLTLNNAPTQIDHPPVMALFSGASGWRGNTAATAGGTQGLTPALYTDADSFLTHVVTGGASSQALTPSIYTDADTFFAHIATAVDETIPALPILEEVFYVPFRDTGTFDSVAFFQSADVNLAPALYTDADGFFTHVVAPGVIDLAPALYTDADAFFTHVLQAGITNLAPTLFSDADTFFTHAVAPGAVNLAPALYTDADAFFTHVLQAAGITNLAPSLFNDADAFFTHTVSPGAVNLAPALYTDADAFFTHVLQAAGITNLAPTLYVDADAFFTHVAGRGAINLAPALYTDADAFFTHVALSVYTLQPALYSDADAFFTPIVLSGAAGIQPSLFVDADTFFTPAITTGVVNVAPTKYSDADAFFTPILLSINPVSPTLFVDGDAFLAPVVSARNTLLPSTFVDADIFKSPIIGNLNDLHLFADHYADPDAFFIPHIRGGVMGNVPRRDWYDEAGNRGPANAATPRPPGTPAEPRS